MSLQVEKKWKKSMAKLTIEVAAEDLEKSNAECIPESKRKNFHPWNSVKEKRSKKNDRADVMGQRSIP